MLRVKAKESLNKTWSMHFVDDGDYDECYDGDVTITKPDGTPLLVLLKGALDPHKAALAWKTLKPLNMKTDNRSVASGIESSARKRLDGTKQNVHRVPRGWEVYSGTIGFFEREVRRPYCHSCAWNLKNPEKFARLVPVLQQCSEYFREHVHDRWHVQKMYTDKTAADFVIPGTVYTTLTVNKNFRTACHLDAGDLEEGFSNMFVIREGLYKGGRLVLPNYRIAVELGHLDLVMFDAHEWHGNTQIIPLTPGATRCSVVCYYREKMISCKSAKEELEMVKHRKLGDKLFTT